MKSTIDDTLPLELLSDILLRLQVKSLCRCKCVIKKWCSLIESPSFVKQHFEQERNQERLLIRIWEREQEGHDVNNEPNQNGEEVNGEPNLNGEEVNEEPNLNGEEVNEEPNLNGEEVNEEPDQEVEYALYIQAEEEDQRQLALENDGDYKCALYVDGTFSKYEAPSHLQMPDEVTDLFGPLNGVFCVVKHYGRRPMALLNPAMKQFKPLPLIRQFPENHGFFDIEIGLGFDPLTGDYKLVALQHLMDLRSEEGHYFAYVCTSDSDSWRLLEDVDPIIADGRVSRSAGVTYLNGVYFWLLEINDITDVAILAFDMMTEKFRKFPVMSHVAQSRKKFLGLRGDSLALLVYDENERCIDVWMMVNEGCWTISARVGPLVGFTWPLCFWKNDELLLETVSEQGISMGLVTLCNISTQESKIILAQNFNHHASLHWAFVYKESLVSIKGEAANCKLWDPSSDFIKNFFKD